MRKKALKRHGEQKVAKEEEVFFSDGVAVGSGSIVLSAGFSEAPNAASSRIYFKFDERWGSHDVGTDFIVSVSFSDGVLYAVGRNGLVKHVGEFGAELSPATVKGRVHEFLIEEVSDRGHLSRVKNLGGANFLACGWGGQVYKVSGPRPETIESGVDRRRETDILDIGGVFPSDVYAVGLNGLLMHYGGRKWEYLDSPTNSHLYSLLYISKHEVYVCGASGGIYRGSRRTWEFIGDRERNDNMWSIAQYNGALYLAYGDRGLLRHDGNEMQDVDFGLNHDPYTHRLSIGGNRLWSIGSHDVLVFDGKDWGTITCPDNE
jgi:hypothetical protein